MKTVKNIFLLIALGAMPSCGEPDNSVKNADASRVPKNDSLVERFVTYSPKEGVKESTPVVLFLNGMRQPLSTYDGIMRFMANRGYYVIGAHNNSYDPIYSQNIFTSEIDKLQKYYNISLNKLIVMGHSLGGGKAFHVMKHFRDMGYGSGGSLILSLDGWFPFKMTQNRFNSLDSRVGLVQMNGYRGTATDPLVLLTIWKLSENKHKYLLKLPANDHSYVEGDYSSILRKKDLTEIVSKLSNDMLINSERGYESLSGRYKMSYDSLYQSVKRYGSTGCDGQIGGALPVLNEFGNDINYCRPEDY